MPCVMVFLPDRPVYFGQGLTCLSLQRLFCCALHANDPVLNSAHICRGISECGQHHRLCKHPSAASTCASAVSAWVAYHHVFGCSLAVQHFSLPVSREAHHVVPCTTHHCALFVLTAAGVPYLAHRVCFRLIITPWLLRMDVRRHFRCLHHASLWMPGTSSCTHQSLNSHPFCCRFFLLRCCVGTLPN